MMGPVHKAPARPFPSPGAGGPYHSALLDLLSGLLQYGQKGW